MCDDLITAGGRPSSRPGQPFSSAVSQTPRCAHHTAARIIQRERQVELEAQTRIQRIKTVDISPQIIHILSRFARADRTYINSPLMHTNRKRPEVINTTGAGGRSTSRSR